MTSAVQCPCYLIGLDDEMFVSVEYVDKSVEENLPDGVIALLVLNVLILLRETLGRLHGQLLQIQTWSWETERWSISPTIVKAAKDAIYSQSCPMAG